MSDRPLGRSLLRLGTLALGRSRAHRQDLWPFMAVNRDTGEVWWRGKRLLLLRPLAQVIPAGQPLIAVVGSGPSLKDQHPERLPPGSAILLNGAASLASRIPAPLAVLVEDERFIFRHHAMIAALPAGLPLILSPAALRAIAERDAEVLRVRPVSLLDNLAKPVNAPRRGLSDPALDAILVRGRDATLSREPEAGVVITGTVATSALQLALSARPREILLAGIDLGNARSEPRFYETAGSAAPSGIDKGLDRILPTFALAREVAGDQGITLLCASPVSLLLSLGYPRDDRLG